ncbi:transporter substrate-binding domain-containing protein [Mastigocoleus testarum]|uniref:ABC transporter substrate-binding protein n=1 Tax=Mastigocoleus testarum BC008 TaxID=371196 RepID=A0A0V7ZW45_9CYAN|nr:transporter substrate-binding domain-containing protein [Mastigocoleus testarum]KST68567.1 ABC transporter substrate-binding protein [Mastigocoleus testarum BC008]
MNNGFYNLKRFNPLHLLLVTAIICLLTFFFVFADNGLVASAAEFKKIQERGYITIAVKDNLPLLGFKDSKGELQGLEIDLARRLASDLFNQPDSIKLQPVGNRERLSVVVDNKVDLAIARVTATESRSRIVSFSFPYYFDGTVLITKNASIQKLTDLKQQKIAVLEKSSTIAPVRYYLPDAKLVGVSSYSEAKEILDTNQAVAFAADASVLAGWVKEDPSYQILETRISTEPLSVVMPKGLQYAELRNRVNQAITGYLKEGWLQKRVEFWGLPESKFAGAKFRSWNQE